MCFLNTLQSVKEFISMKISNFNFFSIENCKKNKDYTSVADFKTEKCLSVSLPHDIAFSATGLTEEQLNFSTKILSLQLTKIIISIP